ncbi:hypothetical protein Gogos_020953 [Gossypium gossypioides]|uniref:Cytochrome P450 n=1 Tax=Gossypium gossypioides TaxID=34282 RepID=A0A7J9D5Y9_GOSGO|nr:hypothetical protein [Gossypium gossypioides]
MRVSFLEENILLLEEESVEVEEEPSSTTNDGGSNGEEKGIENLGLIPNPLEFQPERFMTTHKDTDVRGYDFEPIPFSSGKRMCLGYSFALTLANVLHWFEFETPSGETIDMCESPGMTNPKATPLEYVIAIVFKLGLHRALVVSNWEIAKECLTINDKAFATRPKLASSELLGYNYAMIAFAPYGPYWRQVRKFAAIEFLSNYRLELLKPVRVSEVKTSLQQYTSCETRRKVVTVAKSLLVLRTKKESKTDN